MTYEEVKELVRDEVAMAINDERQRLKDRAEELGMGSLIDGANFVFDLTELFDTNF